MPLPPDLLREVNEAIAQAKREITELEPEIRRASAAGIDVKELKQQLGKAKEDLRMFELQYGKSK
jgi:hypothetical protein